jgi:hypothetical protein
MTIEYILLINDAAGNPVMAVNPGDILAIVPNGPGKQRIYFSEDNAFDVPSDVGGAIVTDIRDNMPKLSTNGVFVLSSNALSYVNLERISAIHPQGAMHRVLFNNNTAAEINGTIASAVYEKILAKKRGSGPGRAPR